MSIETKLLQHDLLQNQFVESQHTILSLILATISGELHEKWSIEIVRELDNEQLPRITVVTASYNPGISGYGSKTVALSLGDEFGIYVVRIMRNEQNRIRVVATTEKKNAILLPSKRKNRFIGVLYNPNLTPLCEHRDAYGYIANERYFINDILPIRATILHLLQTHRVFQTQELLFPGRV